MTTSPRSPVGKCKRGEINPGLKHTLRLGRTRGSTELRLSQARACRASQANTGVAKPRPARATKDAHQRAQQRTPRPPPAVDARAGRRRQSGRHAGRSVFTFTYTCVILSISLRPRPRAPGGVNTDLSSLMPECSARMIIKLQHTQRGSASMACRLWPAPGAYFVAPRQAARRPSSNRPWRPIKAMIQGMDRGRTFFPGRRRAACTSSRAGRPNSVGCRRCGRLQSCCRGTSLTSPVRRP